ncbi:MAG: secretin and TonB N-terminal domain-containing protein [Candidatus Omnitrophica bacterium]|nr:secretin and TonB N-terminal domain-containing protein [Candidatus Omnitrophota bacterium]
MKSLPHRIALALCVAALGFQGPPTLWAQEQPAAGEAVPAAPVAAPSLEEAGISLDFRQAEVQTVLQALARKAGVNIVTTPTVTGEVTLHLEGVTWEQALSTIVSMTGLAYDKQDNVILVSTLEELMARRQAVQQLVAIEPVTTKVIELKFLDAADVKVFLEPQLTAQGKISVLEMTGQKGWDFGAAQAGGGGSTDDRDRRTRENARSKAIVVTDTPTTIDHLLKILDQIDVMPKQILIEARVMEVNRDLLRDLGLELGTGSSSTNINSSSGFVTGTGRTFSQQSLEERQGQTDRSNFGGSLLNQAIDPSIFVEEASGITAANTGLNLLFRKLAGTQLELLIRALEEDVRTNTLSAPHVLTLSGQEARIMIGEKYPILNTQVSGTDTSTTTTTLDYYQDIGIELYVVPQVSGEHHIDMIIHPVVSARTTTVGSNAYPILDVREAETQIVAEQGETVVIGGLLKDVKSKSRIGVPFLGSLPFIGPLFSRSTTDASKVDLLIFITAKVVEPRALTGDETERLRQQYEEFFRERYLRKSRSRRSGRTLPPEELAAQPPAPAQGNRGMFYRKR